MIFSIVERRLMGSLSIAAAAFCENTRESSYFKRQGRGVVRLHPQRLDQSSHVLVNLIPG
jgi:hypothetical protein